MVGVVTWPIEKEVKQANGGAPSPSGCPDNCLFIPAELRPQVIHRAHTSLLSCHLGVKIYHVCDLPEVLVAHHGIRGPGVHRGLFGLRTQQDVFSGSHRIASTTSHPFQPLVGHFHRLHHRAPGLTRKYHSTYCDQQPQFVSRFWKEFCRLIGATASLTSGYHPEANGQTGHLNQQLETGLRCVVHQNPSTWSKHLVWVEYAHNSLPTSATGLSPFHCALGYQPPLFPDNEMVVSVPSAYAMVRRCRRIWAAARQVLIHQGDRVKKMADRKRRPAPNYQQGQRVWLSAKDLNLKVPSKKLAPRFVGPFPIKKIVDPAAVRLRLPRSL